MKVKAEVVFTGLLGNYERTGSEVEVEITRTRLPQPTGQIVTLFRSVYHDGAEIFTERSLLDAHLPDWQYQREGLRHLEVLAVDWLHPDQLPGYLRRAKQDSDHLRAAVLREIEQGRGRLVRCPNCALIELEQVDHDTEGGIRS